jgi:hypothetical protein
MRSNTPLTFDKSVPTLQMFCTSSNVPVLLAALLLLVVVTGCNSVPQQPQSTELTHRPVSLVVDFENALARKLLDETYNQLLSMAVSERPGHAETRIGHISNSINPAYLSDSHHREIDALAAYVTRQKELHQFNTTGQGVDVSASSYASWIETLTHMTADEVHRLGTDDVQQLSALVNQQVNSQPSPQGPENRDDHVLTFLPNTEAGRQAYLDAFLHRVNSAAFTHEVLAELTVQGTESGAELFRYEDNTLYVDLADMGLLPVQEIPFHVDYYVIPGLHLASLFAGSALVPERQAIWAGYMACRMCSGETTDIVELRYHLAASALLVVDTGVHALGWTREHAVNYLRQYTYLNDSHISRHLQQVYSSPGRAVPPVIGRMKIYNKLRHHPVETQRAIHDLLRITGPLPLHTQLQMIDDRLR